MAKEKQKREATDITDAVTHVREQLAEFGGPSKSIGGNMAVCCPFHDDRSPSCSVNLSLDADVRVGTFYCFGCHETGDWNKFAKQAGLVQLKNWQHFEGNTDAGMNRFIKKQIELIGRNNLTIQRLFDEVGNSVIPWPAERNWRSYSGKLIKRIGGYCYDDYQRDELLLVLPVYTNGRYRGGVRAFFEKQKNGLSYLTTKGDWVKSYGLLGYDYMRKKDLWNAKAIVLVEGPRDWLRMAKNKIPACGILGAGMFDEKKMALIVGLGVRKVFAMPDNDAAGIKMHKLIKQHCEKAGISYEYLKLPRKKDEEGKLIKLDPDNCPQPIIEKVKELVFAV